MSNQEQIVAGRYSWNPRIVALQRSWVLWCANGTTEENFFSTLNHIFSISSVAGFWVYMNHISTDLLTTPKSCFYFMVDGVFPRWDDEKNKNGGQVRFFLSNEVGKDAFLELLLMTIGEHFYPYLESDEKNVKVEVTGVSVSRVSPQQATLRSASGMSSTSPTQIDDLLLRQTDHVTPKPREPKVVEKEKESTKETENIAKPVPAPSGLSPLVGEPKGANNPIGTSGLTPLAEEPKITTNPLGLNISIWFGCSKPLKDKWAAEQIYKCVKENSSALKEHIETRNTTISRYYRSFEELLNKGKSRNEGKQQKGRNFQGNYEKPSECAGFYYGNQKFQTSQKKKIQQKRIPKNLDIQRSHK